MLDFWWIVAALTAVGAIALALAWSPLCGAMRESRLADARRDFHLQRERLEAKFVSRAAARGSTESTRWVDCEFDNDVAYVRNRATGELAAFVAIAVAVEDPESPEKPASGFRTGTAVFRFDRKHWDTDGVALLNLTPAEAIRFYRRDLEIVAQELAR
jgi:hypothetical protein